MSRSGAAYGQTNQSNTWTASQTFNGNNVYAGGVQSYTNAGGVTFQFAATQQIRFGVPGGVTHLVVQDNGATGSLTVQDVGVSASIPNGGITLTVTSGNAAADFVVGSKGIGNVITQANGLTHTLADQNGALTQFGSIVSDGPGGTGPGIFASGVAGGVKLRANPSDDTRNVQFSVASGWQLTGFGFTSTLMNPSGDMNLGGSVNVAPGGRFDTWSAGAITVGSINATSVIVAKSGASLGFYGHAAVAQPAAPVTLADVIAIIRGCGLSA